MEKLSTKILMWIFMWSGSKLFRFIAIYHPDDDDDQVRVIHFAQNEDVLIKACAQYWSENDHS